MSDETLLSRVNEHGVLTLTINRPSAKNALTTSMQNVLVQRLYDAANDPAVRVIVLTGAGGSFCSGGDRRALGAPDLNDPMAKEWSSNEVWNSPESRIDRLKRCMQASLLLHRMGKPTIAMVHGAAVGAGMSLALACDFRITSTSGFFMSAFAKIGTSGDFGGSYFLTKLVGPSKAKEIYMLSEKIDAQEALRLGMVTRVVADSELQLETEALANKLSKGPLIAFRYIKDNIQAAQDNSIDSALDLEARNMIRCRTTNDNRIGLEAVEQKRDPTFHGT